MQQQMTDPGTQQPPGQTTTDPGQTGTGTGTQTTDERSNTQFLADMLALRGEPTTGGEDDEMTPEQIALAKLEFKDNIRDNMETFSELLPEGTRSQSQEFIEGIINGDTAKIINAVKSAAIAGIEASQKGEPPRSLQVEGGSSGQAGQGNQKPARSMSEATQRMSNMFGGALR